MERCASCRGGPAEVLLAARRGSRPQEQKQSHSRSGARTAIPSSFHNALPRDRTVSAQGEAMSCEPWARTVPRTTFLGSSVGSARPLSSLDPFSSRLLPRQLRGVPGGAPRPVRCLNLASLPPLPASESPLALLPLSGGHQEVVRVLRAPEPPPQQLQTLEFEFEQLGRTLEERESSEPTLQSDAHALPIGSSRDSVQGADVNSGDLSWQADQGQWHITDSPSYAATAGGVMPAFPEHLLSPALPDLALEGTPETAPRSVADIMRAAMRNSLAEGEDEDEEVEDGRRRGGSRGGSSREDELSAVNDVLERAVPYRVKAEQRLQQSRQEEGGFLNAFFSSPQQQQQDEATVRPPAVGGTPVAPFQASPAAPPFPLRRPAANPVALDRAEQVRQEALRNSLLQDPLKYSTSKSLAPLLNGSLVDDAAGAPDADASNAVEAERSVAGEDDSELGRSDRGSFNFLRLLPNPLGPSDPDDPTSALPFPFRGLVKGESETEAGGEGGSGRAASGAPSAQGEDSGDTSIFRLPSLPSFSPLPAVEDTAPPPPPPPTPVAPSNPPPASANSKDNPARSGTPEARPFFPAFPGSPSKPPPSALDRLLASPGAVLESGDVVGDLVSAGEEALERAGQGLESVSPGLVYPGAALKGLSTGLKEYWGKPTDEKIVDAVLAGGLWVYLTIRPGILAGALDAYLAAPLQAGIDALRGRTTFKRTDFVVGRMLGEGNFGTVFEGGQRKKRTDEDVAIGRRSRQLSEMDDNEIRRRVILKKVKMRADGGEQSGRMEAWFNRRMQRVSPESCAKYLGSFVSDATRGQFSEGGLWLVWDYEADRTLQDYLRERSFPGNLEEPLFGSGGGLPLLGSSSPQARKALVIKQLMRQIILSLKKMHSTGIVHRDIKPANILVTRTGRVKIIDFGAAVDLRVGMNYEPELAQLDPDYAPPEQYVLPEQTPRPPPAPIAALLSPLIWAINHPDLFDTYSAGIIMLQMACPTLRSSGAIQQMRQELKAAKYDLKRWRRDTRLRPDLELLDLEGGLGWDLVCRLVCERGPLGLKRLSADAALRHPYFLLGVDQAASLLGRLSPNREPQSAR